MQHRLLKYLGASVLLASCQGSWAADIPSSKTASKDFPFPVLEQHQSEQANLFPLLPPKQQETDKPSWPPMFAPPEDKPKLALDKGSQSRQFSEMDAMPKQPNIAVIIDDVGYNRRGMEETLALPLKVVLAILPETPFGAKTAHKAYLQQRVTILHAPMENQRELKLGPGGLYANMDEQLFKQTLRDDLDSVPYVKGVNNHMGSLLTTQTPQMEWVMDVMSERSLFFIDSLTNAQSVAYDIAKQRGIPTVTRDVFLDNVRTEEAIDRQFQRLIDKAHKYGSAVAIGHPYPETTAYLKKRLNEPMSVELVGVERLLN